MEFPLVVLPARDFRRAVDLGCGSGAGGLTIAALRPIRKLMLADINPMALALAAVNARQMGLRAQCVESDVFNAVGGDFDLILANPP